MRRRATALLLTTTLLAACGGAGESSPSTSSTTTTSPATTAPPDTTAGSTSSVTTTTTGVATTQIPATSTTAVPRADAVIEVSVAGGEVNGPDRPEVAVGSTVLVVVSSDVSDEAHVHGYDYFLDLTPGSVAELEFVADIPGIFEVELEQSRVVLFELVVR